MPISAVGIGDVPLFQVSTKQFFIRGIDLPTLAQEILATGDKPELRVSNDKTVQGAQFEDTYFEYGEQTKALLDCVQAVGHSLGMDLCGRVWAQVHRPYESCNLHDHLGGPDFGFVFYVKALLGAGKLYFDFGAAGTATIEPIEGMMVIFPSYLKHGVTKNLSGDLRISMAGDFKRKS